jgi:hypothetical protein
MRKRIVWYELVFIALIAALSIVLKPYLRTPFAFVQTTLGIPVGVVAGGLYMFWPLLATLAVPRRGAPFLTCLLQGLVALATGFTGLLGPMAFFSYLASGLVIEGLYLLPEWKSSIGGLARAVVAGGLGNVAGAATNAYLFFALKGTAFSVALIASFLTGAIGGWLAYTIGRRVGRALRREQRAPAGENLAGGS